MYEGPLYGIYRVVLMASILSHCECTRYIEPINSINTLPVQQQRSTKQNHTSIDLQLMQSQVLWHNWDALRDMVMYWLVHLLVLSGLVTHHVARTGRLDLAGNINTVPWPKYFLQKECS